MTQAIKQVLRLTTVLIVAAGLTLPTGLQAQSAEKLVEQAIDKQVERMEAAGVQNYTVVQEMMGRTSTNYFERVERNGETFFVSRKQAQSQPSQQGAVNPYTQLREMGERATRQGTETVDGEECHKLVAKNLEGTQMEESMSSGGQVQPKQATFLLDTDDLLVRKVIIEGTVSQQGKTSEATMTTHMRDYREVEGVVHPFLTDVSITGLEGQISAEQQRKAREAMQQMEERLKKMPPQQREAMKKMMGDRMQKLQQMMTAGGMDMTVKVKDLRVNEGPPQN